DKIEKVLVVTAHPDDSEFGAGGTVAKLVRDGCEVSYVIVTNGNKGSGDRTMTSERLARIREEEQRNAARTLGVARVEFLGYPDCEVEDTRDLRRDITREIRRWRPDLVITMNPHRTYNLGASHRDHRTVAGVTLDCVYPLARGGARQAEGLRVRGDVRPDRHGAMIRYWPALLSVLLSLGAIVGYVAFLRMPVVRNHPELYLVAFALATLIAAAASWRAAR